ncbi:caldesmon-like [Helicoverpa zea]|uniref:caldesmon-like n=1 Tax=Helicoverpa zea TaxID=7113 RepID=UPI001F56ABE7|nr:caldesmon-like [Helicoverpa zea]
MKTIIITFMFITITACGILKDESEKSTEIHHDNAIIVTVIDNNEESSATDTEKSHEEETRMYKRDITVVDEVDDLTNSTINNTNNTTTNDAELQYIMELLRKATNYTVVEVLINTNAFVGDKCPNGKDRAADDEDKSEISTEIQYDNAIIVTVVDNNDGSSTIENEETVAEIHKRDITQVEYQNTIAANDAFKTKTIIYKEDDEELRSESPNEDKSEIPTKIQYDNTTRVPVIDYNEKPASSNKGFTSYDEEGAAFKADVCPSGKDRADDDEDKSEITTGIQYDNTTIVPAIDNNEGSSTTENDEAAKIHQGDITQVEDQNIKTANDSDNITTTNDVGENDLVPSKDKAQGLTNLLKNKPKSDNEGVIMKVRETLENGTKIVIDALGNVIRIHPEDGEDNSKTYEEIVGNKEISKTNNTAAEENKADPNDLKLNQNEKNAKIDDKTTENKNETLKTDPKDKIKDTGNLNATEPSADEGKVDKNRNCTTVDNKACNVTIATRTSLSGDACPPGKKRADDKTCVDVV